jgi:hypothetical protein
MCRAISASHHGSPAPGCRSFGARFLDEFRSLTESLLGYSAERGPSVARDLGLSITTELTADLPPWMEPVCITRVALHIRM